MKKITRICIALFIGTAGIAPAFLPQAASASNEEASVSIPAVVRSSSASTELVVEEEPAVTKREQRIVSAIGKRYAFRERSTSVETLQRLLGGLDVDGYYGFLTRKAHIAALTSRGLSTSHVPDVSYPSGGGPRFPNDPTKRCPKWEDELKEYGLPVEVFSYIAWRESRCNPKAINARWDSKGNMTYSLNRDGTWDSGLVQINSSWARIVRDVCKTDKGSLRLDLQELLTVDCNLRVAKWIMDNTSGKLRNWSIYGG